MVNILLDVGDGCERYSSLQNAVETAVNGAAERCGGPAKAQIGLLIVSDEAIRELNLQHRGIDKPTDVLSFPMLEPGQQITDADIDPETGETVLGDIVISLQAVERQAREYGHSIEREAAYLAVHGMLHLLGRDHETAAGEKEMRALEETVLGSIGLTREESPVVDKELVDMARQARLNAYSPYSGFRVGACLLAKSGKVYTGCNVESASFTPTCCAERTALFTAVAAGEREFYAVAVACDGIKPAWPCGVCRQALVEFSPGMRVIASAESGGWESAGLSELLPRAFTEFEGGRKENE